MGFGFKSVRADEEYKIVVLVRMDLDMGKGKMAAQVGHASVELALRAQKMDRKSFDAWMSGGQKKVVLKVANNHHGRRQDADRAGQPDLRGDRTRPLQRHRPGHRQPEDALISTPS